MTTDAGEPDAIDDGTEGPDGEASNEAAADAARRDGADDPNAADTDRTADSDGVADPDDPEDARADDDAPVSEKRDDGGERKHLPVWQESILLLGVALVLAVVIKTFFVQAFYIPSESMEPGLIRNDRILVQKVSYWFGGDPSRGDVIVFEDPGGWLQGNEPAPTGLANLLSKVGLYPTGGHLVKRVVGTEGDVIECCDEAGRILVNGRPINESDYIAEDHGQCAAEQTFTNQGCQWSVGPIPEGKLFVLGDNRMSSADSRAHMCGPNQDPCASSPWVDKDLVVGKVFSLVWPRARWTWVSNPGTFDDVPDDPPTVD